MDGDGRRSAVIDVIVVLVLAGALAIELVVTGLPVPDEGPVATWRQVLSSAMTLALIASLLVRRRMPLVPLGLAVVAAAAAVSGPVDGSAVLLAAIAVATYSAGAHAGGRMAWIAAAGVVVLVGVAMFDPDEPVETASDVASVAFLLAGPWLAGLAIRERRGREALLEQRAEALRRDQAANEAAAVADERTRIARELHDVVAHAISVIVLQARGARRSLDADPEATRTALGAIDEVGTEALAEMRRLVGIARTDDERATLQPRPGLAALEGLADQLRGAGLDVAIETTGDADPLPPGLDLAAFRIVQEALTNALSHGGHGPVLVTVDRSHGSLELEIADRGPAVPGPVREGHGLTGMRERVQLYGGSMETGPLDGGGFGVRVVLPVGTGPGTSDMIRVLLADDERLVRRGLRMILEADPAIHVVGEAADGVEAIDAASRLGPDVVLMDVRMPTTDGLEATRRIVALDPPAPRVIVLTTFDLDEYVFGALRAGASGFLLKDAPEEHLLSAIRIAAEGGSLFAPSATRRLVEAFARAPASGGSGTAVDTLTPRELEVLRLLAGGLTNAEIADSLGVSTHTAKTHVAHVLGKLDLRDRAQAVIVAYESGVVGGVG